MTGRDGNVTRRFCRFRYGPKRLGPATALFILYNMATGLESGAALAGLGVGFVSGLILVSGVSARKPQARRIAAAMGTTAAIAVVIVVAAAVPVALQRITPAHQK